MLIARAENYKLVADAELDGAVIKVRLGGTADFRGIVPLDDLFKKAHEAALAHNVREAVIDLRELEFMNSSCFIKLVAWLGRIEESKARYKIRFKSSRKHHWQKRTLHALRCFSAEIVVIDAE